MNRFALTSILVVFASLSIGFSGEYQFEGLDKNIVEMAPESDFEASFRVDGWLPQINTGIEVPALGISNSLFIGLDDILRNVDWLVPVGADFRYKRLGFMPDLIAMKLSGGGVRPGRLFTQGSYDMKMAVLNLPVYYRVVDQPGTTVDVLAGARFLWLDLDIGLLGPRGVVRRAGTDLAEWDGIVGLRLEHDLNEKLFYSMYGDVGAGDSDLTYQILAGIGYRFSDKLSVTTGYRYLHYDMGSANADIGMTTSGVQLTTEWKF